MVCRTGLPFSFRGLVAKMPGLILTNSDRGRNPVAASLCRGVSAVAAAVPAAQSEMPAAETAATTAVAIYPPNTPRRLATSP